MGTEVKRGLLTSGAYYVGTLEYFECKNTEFYNVKYNADFVGFRCINKSCTCMSCSPNLKRVK